MSVIVACIPTIQVSKITNRAEVRCPCCRIFPVFVYWGVSITNTISRPLPSPLSRPSASAAVTGRPTYLLTDASLARLFDDARSAELGHVLAAGALPALLPRAAVALLAWGGECRHSQPAPTTSQPRHAFGLRSRTGVGSSALLYRGLENCGILSSHVLTKHHE